MDLRGRLSTPPNIEGEIYRGVGGGSTVSITPVYDSGTKIADYEIDGSEGAIYIPEYPVVDNLSDMEWTKIIDIAGGSYSSYTDVSLYKYVAICFIYQGISYNPYFYKLSDFDKLLSMTTVNELAKGYQWSIDGNYDYFGIHYKSDKTISVKATYSGIRAVVYGIR